uniref:Uncharacterized protein n=1 Tax=Oryza glumipatula TaxID=40148 RepID=A0A0D9ZMG9_9ORYZ
MSFWFRGREFPLRASRRNSFVGANSPAPARDPTDGRRWTEVEAEDAAAARMERAARAAPRRRKSAMRLGTRFPTTRAYRRVQGFFAGERRRRRRTRNSVADLTLERWACRAFGVQITGAAWKVTYQYRIVLR